MGNFHPRAADDPVESLARHTHADSGGGVKQVFDIGEPDGFHFICGKSDLLKVIERDAGGFEIIARRVMGDAAGTDGPGHGRAGGSKKACGGLIVSISS
jgi:hypothetical protein